MASTTNFGWTTPDNTGYVKDGALAIRTLGSAIDTSMAELKGGTTGQVLKKTSGTDMDFEWGTVSSTPRIGQIVQATTSTYTASSSGTYADATGMTATITPTLSTSKVLVTMSFVAGVDGNPVTTGAGGQCQIVRGSTSIIDGIGDIAWYITGPSNYSSAFITSQISFSYLDSPATTSATTYKMQIMRYFSGTYFVNNGSTGIVTLQEVLV